LEPSLAVSKRIVGLHKFKKIGGGRGKPPPSSLCSICGAAWVDHPKIKREPSQTRIRKIKATAVKQPALSRRPRPRLDQTFDKAPNSFHEDDIDVLDDIIQPPKLSPEEEAQLQREQEKEDKRQSERQIRIWDAIKDASIKSKMEKDTQHRGYKFWANQFDLDTEEYW